MPANKKFTAAICTVAFSLCAIQVAGAQEFVKIGVAAPLTGNNAAYGQDVENGVELAVEDANAENISIGGKPTQFSIKAEDDQADPRIGVLVAQRLVDQNVSVVIGHFNSSTILPASKIYSAAGMPMINPAATNAAITQQGSKTIFSIIATDAQNAGNAGKYAVEVTQAKRIAILDDRTAFGQGEADNFAHAVKSANGQIVDRQYTDNKAVDFSAQLTHIKSTKADLLFFGGLNPQAAMIAKRMKQLGLHAQLLGGGGVVEPNFIKLAGNAAEGTMAWEYGHPLTSLPQGKSFEEKYAKKFGIDMLSYAPFAYDATWIAIKAMQAANSTKAIDYLPQLRSGSFDGITGKIEFTDSGALKHPATTLYQVKNGKWVALVTES